MRAHPGRNKVKTKKGSPVKIYAGEVIHEKKDQTEQQFAQCEKNQCECECGLGMPYPNSKKLYMFSLKEGCSWNLLSRRSADYKLYLNLIFLCSSDLKCSSELLFVWIALGWEIPPSSSELTQEAWIWLEDMSMHLIKSVNTFQFWPVFHLCI